MKEAVFTVDNDGDGEAEVPKGREGETKKPEVDLDTGLDDANNDGKTDSSREVSVDTDAEPAEPAGETEEQPGDDELADALGALEEDKSKKIKLIIREEEELLPEGLDHSKFSLFKPWGPEAQYLVYYNPQDRTPPLEGGMVRLAATLSTEGIGKIHRGELKLKHHERNMVVVHVRQPGFKVGRGDPRGSDYERLEYGQGEIDYVSHSIRVDARHIEPADDGRFIDVANWVLKKHKITDRYANILDFNGKVIATKGGQKKFSNAGAISWDED